MPSLRRKSRQWLAGGVAAAALSLAVLCAVVGIAPDAQLAKDEAAEAAALVVNDKAAVAQATEQTEAEQVIAEQLAANEAALDRAAGQTSGFDKPSSHQAEANGVDALEADEFEPAIIVNEATGESYAADRVIVTVDAATSVEDLEAMLADAGIEANEISLILDSDDALVYAVGYSGGQDPASLDGALSSIDEAIVIEPDYIMTLDSADSYEKEWATQVVDSELDATVNDTYFSRQWENTAVKGTSAWDVVKANGNVTVAVIDSGADANHPDLKNNLILGSYAKNTYTETYGASAINDIVGHGTHVAGIIAAQANNSQGTAGITYNARVLPIKVSFNERGQMYTSDIVEAIDYVVDLKQDSSSPSYLKNIRVINMSLGGGSYMSSFQTAINDATAAGILVVATAGNNTGYVSEYYPGGYNNVLCVSALAQSSGTPGFVFDSSYSNWGPMVDISGPGTSLYAPVPTSSYGYKSGTSMAAPVVSGVAALCFAANSGLTPTQVSSILQTTAVDVTKDDDGYSVGSGFDQYTGYGCVQALTAVNKAKGTTSSSYTISLSASPSAGGTVSGGGTYVSGTTITVKATPNSGYNFVKWTENGSQVSTSASYSFPVSSNRTLTAVFEATASATAEVYVGGVGLANGRYLASGSSYSSTTKPSGGYAHYANGVLTLHNYAYTGKGYSYYSDYSAGIYAETSLEIVLEGENVINASSSTNEPEGIVLDHECDLTFSGEGSLDLDGEMYGIYMYSGDLLFEGGVIEIGALQYDGVYIEGDVEVTGGEISVVTTGDSAFDIDEGGLAVTGGDLSAGATYDGIDAEEGTSITGGELLAMSFNTSSDSSYWAINGSFTYSTSMTVLAAASTDGELQTYVPSYHTYYDVIAAFDGSSEPEPEAEVYVGGVGLSDGQYLASGSSTASTTKPSGGYAYYANGELTLHGYAYTGKGYTYSSDYSAGIFAESSLDIVLEGENSLTLSSTSNDPEGIVIGYESDLTFEGEGSLAIDADFFGVYMYDGDLYVEGGELEIAAGEDCIFVDGYVDVYDGTLDLTAADGSAIDVLTGHITVYGGDVTAVAEHDAIQSQYGLYVEGGSLTAMSLNVEEDPIYAAVNASFICEEGLNVMGSTEPDGELEAYDASIHYDYDLIVVGEFAPEPATYTVAVGASPAAGGTVSGAGTYDEGESVTVKATPNSGYKFVKWTENGTQVSTSATYTFTAAANRTLVAVFEAVQSEPEPGSYTITLTASPADGGIVVGAGTYEKGATVTVAAVANSGYKFVKWTESGSQVSTSAAYSFKVSANRALVAVFEAEGSAPEPPYSDLWKSFPDVMKVVCG